MEGVQLLEEKRNFQYQGSTGFQKEIRSQNKEFSKGILTVKQQRVETTIPNFRESTVLYKQSTLLQLLHNLSLKSKLLSYRNC
jgi:hypothetical protein